MYFDRSVELELRYFIKRISEEEQYDYIILMTRKMYSLFRSFEVTTTKTPIIISDAIAIYGNALVGKRVLIVDDILIHGRTVSNIVNRLRNIGVCEVSCRVFVVSIDPDSFKKSNGLESFRYSLKLTRPMWRKVSRLIVNRIQETPTPLRSACSFICFPDVTCGVDEFIQRLGPEKEPARIKRQDPEYKGIDTFVWCMDLSKYETVVSDIIESVYVQFDIVHGKKTKAIVVPHVFMKPIHVEDMQNISMKLYGNMCIDLVAQYQLLKYLMSRWVVKKLYIEMSNTSNLDIHIDNSDEKYYLPYEICTQINTPSFESSFWQKLGNISVRRYNNEENRGNIMEYIAKRTKDKNSSFLRYICECGFADEVLNSTDRKSRIDGARISFITQKIGMQYSDIVYMLTMSIATLGHKCSYLWLTERIVPGEQAFAYFMYEKPGRLLKCIKEKLNGYEDTISGENDSENMNYEIEIITEAIETYQDKKKAIPSTTEELYDKYYDYMTDVDVYSMYSCLSDNNT